MDDTDSPKLDSRSHDDVIAQTEALATAYTVGTPSGPWRSSDDGTLDFGGALIRLFGGMVDHLVTQLNRVPDKHRRAFTGLLGARRIAPQPARAPVTFLLSPGNEVGEVPAGAQVAGTGANGPFVFETELALPLTRAQLAAVFVRQVADTGPGGYADRTAFAIGDAPGTFAALGDGSPIEHYLYVAAESLLAVPGAGTLTVVLDSQGVTLPANKITWATYGANGWSAPIEVAAAAGRWTAAIDASAIGAASVNGVTARWLRATVPVAPPPVAITTALTFSVPESRHVPLDAAFVNGQPVDFTRDVLPFGDHPRFNDTFYLASDAAFAVAGTSVALRFTLTLPPLGVNASSDLMLRWETWNGQTATEIGTTAKSGAVTDGLTDETRAFTLESGRVSFTLSQAVPRATIGSVTSRWVRVRIIAGNYGQDLRATTDNTGKVTITPADVRPPSLSSVTLAWSGAAPAQSPSAVVRQTARTYEDLSAGASGPLVIHRAAPELVYQQAIDASSSLQLGFDRAFEPSLTTLYIQTVPPASPEPARFMEAPPPRNPPHLVWEYWNGGAWTVLTVEDGTLSLSRSGLVRFLPPADMAPLAQFGRTLYWLRVRVLSAAFAPMPQLGRVLVNTVWAAHAHTTTLEVLGASNGARDQQFIMAQTPVLDGQRVEVGEPEQPPPSELAALEAVSGDDVITPDPAAGLVWVRWNEVPDFWASGPRDRHYTIERATGAITFGNGTAGMIPPTGVRNIRAAAYRAGGGVDGNVAAGAIAQLKTTVATVERAINVEPAVGGAPLESEAVTLARAARTLRHGGRAVTAQDFADLALEASLAVARAVTLTPSFLPIAQGGGPLSGANDLHRDGQVIVVIVPATAQPGRAPSVDLCARVEDYLRARCAPDVRLTVTGPTWVAADITLRIAIPSIERADAVVVAVRTAIAQLLDPLTGGDGSGWPFGRPPRASDLVARVTQISDVDHLSSVEVICGAPFGRDDDLDPQHEISFDALSLYDRLLVYARSITVTVSPSQVVP